MGPGFASVERTPRTMSTMHRILSVLLLGTATVAYSGCEEAGLERTEAVPEETISVLVLDTLVTAESGEIGVVASLALGPEGRVWIADEANHRLLVVDPDGGPTRRIGREGSGPGEFIRPRGIAASASGVSVFDFGNRRIVRLGPSGEHLASEPLVGPAFVPVGMNQKGTLASNSLGREGSLVELRAPGQEMPSLRGLARSRMPMEISPARVREQARGGEVPVEFRNNTLPVLGAGGELWFVLQSDGTMEHYDPDGNLVWSRLLDQPEVGAALERFFSAWAGSVTGVPVPWIARWGVQVGDEVWLMMDGVGPSGSTILILDGASGEPRRRIVLELEGRAGPFAVDREGRSLYLSLVDDPTLLRVPARHLEAALDAVPWEP